MDASRSRRSAPLAPSALAIGLAAFAAAALAGWPAGAARGQGDAPTPMARAYLPYLPGALPPPTVRPLPSATATRPASATPEAPTATATASATATTPAPATPGVPDCARTTGDAGGLRLSLDGGRTVLPNARTLPPVAYTWAVVARPDLPNDLLELHQGRVYRSRDAGCTLTQVAGVPAGDWTALDRAPSDARVWVLTSINQPRIAYSLDDGATWAADGLPDDSVHFAIDPDNPLRWSFVGRNPVRYERAEIDVRWQALPIEAAAGEQIVSASHGDGPEGTTWLVGTATNGVLRSTDGAAWERASQGLYGPVGSPPEETTAVVPSWITIAPSDPGIAYLVANRVARNASERAIFRSEDGGASWAKVVVNMQDVDGVPAIITGGTRVWADPADPRHALFAYGSFIEGYGVDFFRSTDGLTSLATSHFDGFYELLAVAFGPPGTDVLYVGASSDVPAATRAMEKR